MDRLKALWREPALLLDAAETLLVLLVAFGLHLSGDQQSYIVAVLIAVVGLVKAFSTQPFPVSAVTDLGRAALVLAMSFGLHVDDNQVAVAVTFLGTLTTLVARSQVSPRYDLVTSAHGAGAGPVTTQGGYTTLGSIGIGLAVLGAVLLLLVWFAGLQISIVVPLAVFVVGVVLALIDLLPGGRGRV